jgi:exopolysaccharide biosynthesis polyprenyl glycosylphosphotransferase
LPTIYEQITGRVPVATVEKLWFLENLSENEKQFYEFFKRGFDIIFTLIAGLFGLLIAPFVALGIKLTSPGPVLFIQKRVGRHGKIFRAMKFRTMYEGSETSGPQWTKKDDPRVTSFGRFLRKTKLDEIPQLINILRGEMSYIGPRPEQPEFVAFLMREIPYYNERHLIKPGLTGWAQINFPDSSASREDTLIKLQYDLYYIKNRSLLLDIGIILKTINIVLSGKGR